MPDDADLPPFALPTYTGRPRPRPRPTAGRPAVRGVRRPTEPTPEPATLGRRVAAGLIDLVITVVMLAPGCVVLLLVFTAASSTDVIVGEPDVSGIVTGALLLVLGYAGSCWHLGWRQRERGQTWGKQTLGIALVSAWTLAPPGDGGDVLLVLMPRVLGRALSSFHDGVRLDRDTMVVRRR